MAEPLANTLAWLWWFQRPHPQEPLLKGSAKAAIKGFIQFQANRGCATEAVKSR